MKIAKGRKDLLRQAAEHGKADALRSIKFLIEDNEDNEVVIDPAYWAETRSENDPSLELFINDGHRRLYDRAHAKAFWDEYRAQLSPTTTPNE